MKQSHPNRRARTLGSLLLGFLLLLAVPPSRVMAADAGPLAQAQAALDLGNALLDAGLALEDATRIRTALGKLTEAESLLRDRLDAPYPALTSGQKRRAERQLLEVTDLVAFCREYLALGGPAATPPTDAPDADDRANEREPASEPAASSAPSAARSPERREQETASRWARRVHQVYEKTPAPDDRAAVALALAREAGIVALPVLFEVFESEPAAEAREGIHAALAEVGTSRVARRMAAYARRSRSDRWRDALEVTYRCLEQAESEEPERPFVRTIRTFHKLENPALSSEILDRLDALGDEGVAALGQILYIDDFGHHTDTIARLSGTQDARAVPPLVFKMNRFKFDRNEQVPAHEALLKLGWYAVPALIDRLDDRAAGIWISWTLRKITKQTYGTQKRKWHEWWKQEKRRHPELVAE